MTLYFIIQISKINGKFDEMECLFLSYHTGKDSWQACNLKFLSSLPQTKVFICSLIWKVNNYCTLN